MTYAEYKDLIQNELPELRPHFLPVSPPEMLKIVAVRLFQYGITTGEIVDETRARLDHLLEHGTHGFD